MHPGITEQLVVGRRAVVPFAVIGLLLTACPAREAGPSPRPSPQETREATQEPTEGPTEGPTEEPTEEPGPTEDAIAATLEELLARVPEERRDSCEEDPHGFSDALFTLSCTPTEGADAVYYAQYDDEDLMYGALDNGMPDNFRAAPPDGRCSEGEEASATYTLGDDEEPAGALLCWIVGDEFEEDYDTWAELRWTHDDLLILGHANRLDADLAALYEWWSASGTVHSGD